jgi:hypothetical protein
MARAISFGPVSPHLSVLVSARSQYSQQYRINSVLGGVRRAAMFAQGPASVFDLPAMLSLEKTQDPEKLNGFKQTVSVSTHHPPRSSSNL